jgi:formate dehydrogenase subunit gamma
MSVLTEGTSATGAPTAERVRRHLLIDRIYHWVMAATVLTLIYTAFWPTVFEGKTVTIGDIHWEAGIVLTALVVFHIIRAVFWQNWRSMFADRADFENISRVIAARAGRGGAAPHKAGKYNGLQKIFHLGIAVFILSLVGTGVFMLFKYGTPSAIPFTITPKNPYLVPQPTWDFIYALHGLAGAAMVGMVIIHIYFAIRPDEWHLTRSMFRGWISRSEYEGHHDPARWPTKRK